TVGWLSKEDQQEGSVLPWSDFGAGRTQQRKQVRRLSPHPVPNDVIDMAVVPTTIPVFIYDVKSTATIGSRADRAEAFGQGCIRGYRPRSTAIARLPVPQHSSGPEMLDPDNV